MITFNNKRLYVKGTCNVICEDIDTGDILFQNNKVATGNINVAVSLEAIRAGYGNPIASMIPTGTEMTVDFTTADFQIWAKAAQLGSYITYSAPVPVCQTVVAGSSVLSVDIVDGTPVPELGDCKSRAYVQVVGEQSLIESDGTAYDINSEGIVEGYTATEGKTYKVWYFVRKPSAKMVAIDSFVDPKVVRFVAQIAVYTNAGVSGTAQGTRVGWLYYTVPYLKLQGDADINGNQQDNDSTKISGKALAYDSGLTDDLCEDNPDVLGFMVYVPNEEYDRIQGLALVGGTVSLDRDQEMRIPISFVMNDGSLVSPTDYTEFEYELAEGGSTYVSISEDGVATGVAVGETECEVYYEDDMGDTYYCVFNIEVKLPDRERNVVGFGRVGYMLIT